MLAWLFSVFGQDGSRLSRRVGAGFHGTGAADVLGVRERAVWRWLAAAEQDE
ncbi:hypothetical protein [Streptomyces colonosanans]|uniref:hypothetical protein n=1 Tax=Streptomyces colonosanans TaxID=1428652 RepID=UPI000A7316DC|nr:hypothetical protein [Streptomyces colonosanans]